MNGKPESISAYHLATGLRLRRYLEQITISQRKSDEKQGEKMKNPNVVHVLANGKRVKSIEGRVIPADNPVYRIIADASLTKSGEDEKKLA